MRCGVVSELCQRPGTAGSTLIEENDAIDIGVEVAAVHRLAPTAWPTMDEQDWNPLPAAALLDIQLMERRDGQILGLKGFDRGVQNGIEGIHIGLRYAIQVLALASRSS
jgi:hypothetical protein